MTRARRPGADLFVRRIAGVDLEMGSWAGAGTVILFLHEGLGSLSMWRDFPGLLSKRTRHPVVAWSRRGYGWSAASAVSYAPDYMHIEAELLRDLIDALGLKRVILFGHSDGGSIALIAAALHPERVAGLILEAPHVYVEQLTVDSIGELRALYPTKDIGLRLAKYHRDPEAVFWRWNDIWLDPRFRDWNIDGLLSDIKAPALLIQGDSDEYGSLDQLDRIETVLKARRLVLPFCGHSPHRDQAQKVLDASAAFLHAAAS